jgi:hypothetical protein
MDQLNASATGGEKSVQRRLIDQVLVLSAAAAVLATAVADLRATRIGWSPRDLVQATLVLALVGLALFRHRLPASRKAPALILIYVFGGLSGVTTLGMLAGAVFFLPLAMVVVALFYSVRTTVWAMVAMALLCCATGVAFCSGLVEVKPGIDSLMTSYLHWSTYVGCFVLCAVVACMTIVRYRRQVAVLLHEVSEHRDRLATANAELTAAMADVKRLSGLIPICSSCKRIRDDEGYWEQIESYIRDRSEASFSHGICPECVQRLYPDLCDPVEEEKRR